MQNNYQYVFVNPKLEPFVDHMWYHINELDTPQQLSIFPDSFFKIVIYIDDNFDVSKVLQTGIWTKKIEVSIPARTKSFGIKFKVLAPEYIFNEDFGNLKNQVRSLPKDFLNFNEIDFSQPFFQIAQAVEKILEDQLAGKSIDDRKLRLSEIVDSSEGNINVNDLSDQIAWSSKQITRYLNRVVGISTKEYLNIRRLYHSYPEIVEGKFMPNNGFYDQSHFLRELKKHAGVKPRNIHQSEYNQTVQLKNIRIKNKY